MIRGEQMTDGEMHFVLRSIIEAGAAGEAARAAYGGGGGADGAGQAIVPAWFKTAAGWWGDGLVSDGEFVAAALYVLDNEIVSLP